MGELAKTEEKQLPAKPYAEPRQQMKLVTEEEKQALTTVLVTGDLAQLKPEQKWVFYKGLCERLGLDPFTRPFKLIKFQGKETLYADATLAEQLASLRNLTVETIEEYVDTKGNLVIKVKVFGPEQQRFITARGVLVYEVLVGEAAANAQMKCETKAFRRGVLKYCGLSEYQGAEDAPQGGVEVEVGPAKEAPQAVVPRRRTAVAPKEKAPAAPPPEEKKPEPEVAEAEVQEPESEPGTEAEEVHEVDEETGEVYSDNDDRQEPEPEPEEQPKEESTTKRRKGWG